MKKQINPTIKPHLIRSAFYLLLLVTVCAIPFALAQRNRLSSTKAHSTKAPATKAQIAAAQGKVFQSGAPGALAGQRAAPKAASQSNADSRFAASDVRSAPKLPRMSQVPLRNVSAPSARAITAPPRPRAGQVVLYDQYNNATTVATGSQEFPDFPDFTDFTADDFVVPAGATWNVESIDTDGIPFNCSGSCVPDNFNVFFYTDSAGLPGTQIYSGTAQSFVISGSTYTINLAVPAVLTEGTYWVSVQAHEVFTGGGQWGWTDRSIQSNSPAAWQNPGGGFGVCPTWAQKLTCIPTAGGPDNVFRLNGTGGGGGTPSPTPTGTPAGCSDYTTSTGSGTITPGDTDTGNHCDDCATAVSLPLPISVYGQTYNSINVASNGSLDLVGTEAPFTHGCQVLPNTLWETAILPYQDDLRTDAQSGCSVFPGGTCGIFTTTTGSAPNRTFYVEWRAVHFADVTTTANFEVVFQENDSTHFDVIYGATSDSGLDETSGVQANGTSGPATTFSCGEATLTSGLQVTYTCAGGGASPTPTPTAT